MLLSYFNPLNVSGKSMYHLPLRYETLHFVTLLCVCMILTINTDCYSQHHHRLEADGFTCEAGLKVYVAYNLGQVRPTVFVQGPQPLSLGGSQVACLKTPIREIPIKL
jgi:hypothetical protein